MKENILGLTIKLIVKLQNFICKIWLYSTYIVINKFEDCTVPEYLPPMENDSKP